MNHQMKLFPLQGLPNYYAVKPKQTRPILHCPEFHRHMTEKEKTSFVRQLARIDPDMVLDVPVRVRSCCSTATPMYEKKREPIEVARVPELHPAEPHSFDEGSANDEEEVFQSLDISRQRNFIEAQKKKKRGAKKLLTETPTCSTSSVNTLIMKEDSSNHISELQLENAAVERDLRIDIDSEKTEVQLTKITKNNERKIKNEKKVRKSTKIIEVKRMEEENSTLKTTSESQVLCNPKETMATTKFSRGQRFRSEYKDSPEQADAVLDLLRDYRDETKKKAEQGIKEELSKRQKGAKLNTLLGGNAETKKRQTESNLLANAKSPPTRSCDNVPGFFGIGIGGSSRTTQRTITESEPPVITSHSLIAHKGKTMPTKKPIIDRRLSEAYKNESIIGIAQYDPHKAVKTRPAKPSTSSNEYSPQSETEADMEDSFMNTTETTIIEPSGTDMLSLNDDRNKREKQQLPQAEAAHETNQQVQRKRRNVTPYAKRKPRKRVRVLNSDEEEDNDQEFRLPGHYKRRKRNQIDSSENTTLKTQIKKQADHIKKEPVEEEPGPACPFIRRSGRKKEKRFRYQDDDDLFNQKQIKQELTSPVKAVEKTSSFQANNPSCSYAPRRVKTESPEEEENDDEIQVVKTVEPLWDQYVQRLLKEEPITPKKYNTSSSYKWPKLPTFGPSPSSSRSSSYKSEPESFTSNTPNWEPSETEMLEILSNMRIERLFQNRSEKPTMAEYILIMNETISPHKHRELLASIIEEPPMEASIAPLNHQLNVEENTASSSNVTHCGPMGESPKPDDTPKASNPEHLATDSMNETDERHVRLWTIEEAAEWIAATCPEHRALKDFIINEHINGLALINMTKFDLEKHFDNQGIRFGDKCNFYAVHRDLMIQYDIKTWD